MSLNINQDVGADCRCPTETSKLLTACIDWFQLTIKDISLPEIINDVLHIPRDFMFGNIPCGGFSGHSIVAGFDNIKIAEPTGKAQYKGFQVLMSGSGCRQYEYFLKANNESWFDFFSRILKYNVNVPRLDLAIDDRKPYFEIPTLTELCKNNLISTRLEKASHQGSLTFDESASTSNGASLYLGSSSSDFRVIFYEKGFEQAEKFDCEIDPNWNRYELRFRHKLAKSVLKELSRGQSISSVANGILKDKIRFLQKPEHITSDRKRNYPTYPPWEDFLKDTEKLRLTVNPKSLDDYIQRNRSWILTSVAPSIKMQIKWEEEEANGQNIIDEIKSVNMNESQRAHLENYKYNKNLNK